MRQGCVLWRLETKCSEWTTRTLHSIQSQVLRMKQRRGYWHRRSAVSRGSLKLHRLSAISEKTSAGGAIRAVSFFQRWKRHSQLRKCQHRIAPCFHRLCKINAFTNQAATSIQGRPARNSLQMLNTRYQKWMKSKSLQRRIQERRA